MPIDVRLPRLSQATTEATVVSWLKAEGDQVDLGEPLLEVLSDKATVEIESPAAGTLLKIAALPEDVIPVGKMLCVIGTEQQGSRPVAGASPTEPDRKPPSETVDPPRVEARGPRQKVRATPAARRMAKELSVDLTQVRGTGPRAAITPEDVRAAAGSWANSTPAGTNATVTVPADQDRTDLEIVPLTGVRKMMADRVMLGHRTQVAVTTVAEVDMASVRDLRTRINASYTAYAVRAAALALRDHPALNASLQGQEIHRFKRIHISVALDTEQGLLVPVVRDVDRKGLATLHAEIQDLARRGREGSLEIEEMQGGTFTVTNSGVFGSLLFTPVINYPQSATLGMGKIADTPVVREGQVVVRPMMYLCLSYDHRHIEGATAVRFLQEVKTHLEDAVARLSIDEPA